MRPEWCGRWPPSLPPLAPHRRCPQVIATCSLAACDMTDLDLVGTIPTAVGDCTGIESLYVSPTPKERLPNPTLRENNMPTMMMLCLLPRAALFLLLSVPPKKKEKERRRRRRGASESPKFCAHHHLP